MKIRYFLLLLFCNAIHSQTDYFELKSLRAKDIAVIEAKFKSKKIRNTQSQTYDSDKNLAKPIQYFRESSAHFPEASVAYYFTKKDSVVKSISFSWLLDINKTDTHEQKVMHYNLKFDSLVSSLSDIFGAPKPFQGKPTIFESPVDGDTSVNYERKVVWTVNSKTVTALMVWAENHGAQMITTIR